MKHVDTNTDFFIYLSYPLNRHNSHTFCGEIENSIRIGNEIRAYLIDWEKMDGFPKSHLYVPAEHELFVQTAYRRKYINERQIQVVNCDIIQKCDLLVVFGSFDMLYGNLTTDVQIAKTTQVPIYTMPDLSKPAIDALRFTMKCVLKINEEEDEE